MAKLYFIVFILLNMSCHSSKITNSYKDSIPFIGFCDLQIYKGKQVHIKCYYSGVDEYWSLSYGGKCKDSLRFDLEFEGNNPYMPEKFKKVFRQVVSDYNNSFLKIEAIGVFENDKKDGYGHLGSCNSRFLVSELIKATLIKK